MKKLIRNHDIFVLPSIKRTISNSHESCPSVILEAITSGLPVVARIEPGIDEIFEDGKT